MSSSRSVIAPRRFRRKVISQPPGVRGGSFRIPVEDLVPQLHERHVSPHIKLLSFLHENASPSLAILRRRLIAVDLLPKLIGSPIGKLMNLLKH